MLPADRLSAAETQAFSRPLVVDDVPDTGLDQTIEANSAECDAVAAEIGILAIRGLTARLDVARQPSGRVHVTGMVDATVTQDCVVSLEPFDSDLSQAVDITFAPAPRTERVPLGRQTPPASRRRQRPGEEEAIVPARVVEGEDDPPDPIIDGRIDLGAIAVEFLTLALDFYPRKPGVQFSDVVGEPGDEKPSAFAGLARLKDRS